MNLISFITRLLNNPEKTYEYGTVKGKLARRHLKNLNVQFILWEKGDQKNGDITWHDFDSTWWRYFRGKQI